MTPECAALALRALPELDSERKHRLLAVFGGFEQLAEASDSSLAAAGLTRTAIDAWRSAAEAGFRDDVAWSKVAGNHLLTLSDPAYPEALRELHDAPLVLWASGDLDLLAPPKIALVGSRNPTRGGEQNARAFARDLAARGLVIVSGLASGIDAAAHRGALEAEGMTIAVVGTGADRVYPAANRDLMHAIAQSGLVLSELPLGSAPRPHHFPRRNRLISALSAGVLVVEAALRSGSLITARLAGEQGRSVMAIPGSIHNPMSHGCHRLIREGARLVENSNDVLEEIGSSLHVPTPATTAAGRSAELIASDVESEFETQLPSAHRQLLDCLGHDPMRVDELVARSGEPTAHVSSMLLLLELSGHVARERDGRFTRKMTTDGTIGA